MVDTTLDDSLYKKINWMIFAGNSFYSYPTNHKKYGKIQVGMPYLDIYASRGFNDSDDRDLVRSQNGETQEYAILILDRDKTPASKKSDVTDIVSASGVYVEDHGLYTSGKVEYTCLLTPRYGDAYGIDACYDMLMQFLSTLESIVGYGCLHDSYENRWCYAAFSGASDIQKYENSISFKLSFTTKPQWYSNDWANFANDKTYIEISDFTPYTGRSDSGAVTQDKMYKLKMDRPQDCSPLLLIKCDSSASAWSLTFPQNTSTYSDTDIRLNFRYSGTFFVDCINQGYSPSMTESDLESMSITKQGLLYSSPLYETIFKEAPYRYPVLRRGTNYFYGSGIKSITIYTMDWQL